MFVCLCMGGACMPPPCSHTTHSHTHHHHHHTRSYRNCLLVPNDALWADTALVPVMHACPDCVSIRHPRRSSMMHYGQTLRSCQSWQSTMRLVRPFHGCIVFAEEGVVLEQLPAYLCWLWHVIQNAKMEENGWKRHWGCICCVVARTCRSGVSNLISSFCDPAIVVQPTH